MADSMSMSLDEIIQQNRVSRTRGRGRGRGRGGRGRGAVVNNRSRSRNRGNTTAETLPTQSRGPRRGRGRSQSRGPQRGRGRSQSRGPQRGRDRSQSRGRSQSKGRSQSRQRFTRNNVNNRARSASRSRSQLRSLTPKGRAGLFDNQDNIFIRKNQYGLRRSNSQSSLRGNQSVHSRLGLSTGRGRYNLRRPLAVPKRGISKRGRGFMTTNNFNAGGLRSDQIIKEQRNNLYSNNKLIKSQTFKRSKNLFNTPSQLTVKIPNDFAKRRRNSVSGPGYLNKQSLAQLINQYGGYNKRKGPGSVKSLGSNRSGRSNTSNRSTGSRGRGRGRGGSGVGRKFVNKQILDPKLQRQIAVIQGKSYANSGSDSESPSGVNFSPTPTATTRSLHQRFASM